MAKNTKYSLWITGTIIILLGIVFAFCCPLGNVNAPEFDNENLVPLYCDDGSLCPVPLKNEENSNEVSIPRETAKQNILNGEYTSVLQTHALEVWLTGKNGITYITRENIIDEIFSLIEECGEPCKNIDLATE